MGTQVKSGSPGAARLFNAALFTDSCHAPTWVNLLTGPMPQTVAKGERKQTDRGAPIVRVTDLSKSAGDTVTVDIFHKLNGLPTMGDRKIEGRGESMSQAHQDIKILQGRHMVDSGGQMTQKRTKHNLRQIAKGLLTGNSGYIGRLKDEIFQCHLMGARGDFTNDDTILPYDDHEEFMEFMINPLTPPTYNRQMYGGDATALDNLDAADMMTLAVIDNLKLRLDEMGNPLQPILLPGDEIAAHDPMYVFYASPRQWNDLNESSTMKDWQKMTADAMKRSAGFNHVLFKGDCAMRNNILIKKMSRTTRFSAGSQVSVSTNSKNATTTILQPSVAVERGVLLGAQAVAHAFGMSGKKEEGGHHFRFTEEPADRGNSHESIIWWMDGLAKLRFKDKSGTTTDHGVFAVDTAVSGL